MKKRMEVILHPVRMRILQSFLTGDRLTAQQIHGKLKDVAIPTLYRHLNTLLAHEIIEVVEENQVRGTVEKVYALRDENVFDKEDLQNATREEHLQYFLMFLTSLYNQFHHYMMSDEANILKDNVSYRQVQLYLTDDEFFKMFQQIRDAVLPMLKNEPNGKRNLYTISTILFPTEFKGKEKK